MAIDDARILVIGAGVNGSVCAARLFERGVDVTVLARGKRLAEIERNGIVIENPFSQKRRVAKVPAVGKLAPDDTYDYILVVVRRNQVAEVLPTLAANTSPNVVFMNNNLNGPAEIVAALGPRRPMLGFVFAGGKRDGEIIRAIGPFDDSLMRTPFGEINGVVTPRLKRLVELARSAGVGRAADARRRSPLGGYPVWRSGPGHQKSVRHEVAHLVALVADKNSGAASEFGSACSIRETVSGDNEKYSDQA